MIKDIIDANKSINATEIKLKQLKELFPGAFYGDSVDLEYIKNQLKDVKTTKEGYELNFLGKSYAKLLAALDSETVIIPDLSHNQKEENKNSKNLYITADNLEALKHLLKSYWRKVKMIYIDPPYNTGSDGFVYNDRFNFTKKDLLDKLGFDDEQADHVLEMIHSSSSSHSAWLTFMYPRLYLAKQLLTEDGIIFISIDENEQANLQLLCADIFGDKSSEVLIWRKNGKQGNTKNIQRFKNTHEYIVAVFMNKSETSIGKTKLLPNWKGTKTNPDNDPRGPWESGVISRMEEESRPESDNYYSISLPSGRILTREFYVSKKEFNSLIQQNKIYFPKDGDGIPRLKIFQNEEQEYYFDSIIDEMGTFTDARAEIELIFGDKDVFDTPKPVKILKELIRATTSKSDIIMDFFAGSSTTAHSMLELNSEDGGDRKFILVQLKELTPEKSTARAMGYQTIDELGRERINRAAKLIQNTLSEKINRAGLITDGLIDPTSIDFGFKHFEVKVIENNQLTKLESFNPEVLLIDRGILDEFGVQTILTTWMNLDGYGLSRDWKELRLADYMAYQIDGTIYLLNPDVSNKAVKALLEKYEDDHFVCNKIVMFGYSFTMSEIQSIKDNLKQVEGIRHITLDIIVRY